MTRSSAESARRHQAPHSLDAPLVEHERTRKGVQSDAQRPVHRRVRARLAGHVVKAEPMQRREHQPGTDVLHPPTRRHRLRAQRLRRAFLLGRRRLRARVVRFAAVVAARGQPLLQARLRGLLDDGCCRTHASSRVPLLLHPTHRGARHPPSNLLPHRFHRLPLLESRQHLLLVARRQPLADAAAVLARRHGSDAASLHKPMQETDRLARHPERSRDAAVVSLRLLRHRDQQQVALGRVLGPERAQQPTAHEDRATAIFGHDDTALCVEPCRGRSEFGQVQHASSRLSHPSTRRSPPTENSQTRAGDGRLRVPRVLGFATRTHEQAARSLGHPTSALPLGSGGGFLAPHDLKVVLHFDRNRHIWPSDCVRRATNEPDKPHHGSNRMGLRFAQVRRAR